MKRLFDVVLSAFGLLILSPVVSVTALLVRWKLGAPVIFRQTRPGLDGEPFELYKFRTMTEEKDADGMLLPDGMRLTPFGRALRKYSLDELPQLVNVLKGDISLVGPRPLLMQYLELYNSRQMRRHEVKPGITGWAQVNGRNSISWEEKFEMDVWYVENQSIWLDMKILYMTIKKVLNSEGINQEGESTAKAFTGSRVNG